MSDAMEELTLAEAASRFAVSSATLRRLADAGRIPAHKRGRAWVVSADDVERYLQTRRSGSPSARLRSEGPYLRREGEDPNRNLRDSYGWRFSVRLNGDTWTPFVVWVSMELVSLLRDENFDPADIVDRAAEGLVEDRLLLDDELAPGAEIVLGHGDRETLLRAAGVGVDHYRPGEAPAEEGVTVVHDFTARDFASDGLWSGDTIPLPESPDFVDVIVVWEEHLGRRRVRTVRVPLEAARGTRQEVLTAALTIYRSRCRRSGELLGDWLYEVEDRLARNQSQGGVMQPNGSDLKQAILRVVEEWERTHTTNTFLSVHDLAARIEGSPPYRDVLTVVERLSKTGYLRLIRSQTSTAIERLDVRGIEELEEMQENDLPVARVPTLTFHQQIVIRQIYEIFARTGSWPTFQYIDKQLDRHHDLDLNEQLASMPQGLVNRHPITRAMQQQSALGLYLAGVVECPQGADDVNLFMKVLNWLVDRERSFAPSDPTAIEQLRISKAELVTALHERGWKPSDLQLTRVLQLIQDEPNIWTGIGGEGDHWAITVAEQIRRYRGVGTIDDYFARRDGNSPAVRAAVERGHGSPMATSQRPVSPAIYALGGAGFDLVPANGSDALGVAPMGAAAVKRVAFILMPFAPQFNDIHGMIQTGCREVGIPGLVTRRADEITQSGQITAQIIESIRQADVIVADVTESNPNVMYELGFADALQKPVILLSEEGGVTPFDIAGLRQIRYQREALAAARATLVAFLKTMLRDVG